MSQPCDLIDFRQAMRMLAGGVSVITGGSGEDRTGLTATWSPRCRLHPRA